MENVLRNRAKFSAVVENYIGITTKLKTLPNPNRNKLRATGGTSAPNTSIVHPNDAIQARKLILPIILPK